MGKAAKASSRTLKRRALILAEWRLRIENVKIENFSAF
jgi:hypothetical protein